MIDHYYETNLELVSSYSNKFAQLSKFDLSGDEVYEYALWGALQRNLRIMGTLTSLYIHKNKKFRIMDLPRIISNSTVANEIGESELSNFYQTQYCQNLMKGLKSYEGHDTCCRSGKRHVR